MLSLLSHCQFNLKLIHKPLSSSTGDDRLQGRKYLLGVLDEATQATEPESLVGFMHNIESAVLVGDGQQLPPTVKCKEAADLGLDISLFERLQSMGLTPHLLNTQYRMHPTIAAFSSMRFYGGKMISGVESKDRPLVRGVKWPKCKVGSIESAFRLSYHVSKNNFLSRCYLLKCIVRLFKLDSCQLYGCCSLLAFWCYFVAPCNVHQH